MKPEQKSLRIGAAVIVFAVALRLLSSSIAADLTALLTHPTASSVLLYLGTGRVFPVSGEGRSPEIPETTAGEVPEETQPPATVPVFSQGDLAAVSVTNHPGYSVDVEALLTQPLSWELTGTEPTVLILHSHTCESYENTEGYSSTGAYRTTDTRYNMVSIGSHLAACLKSHGISVLHDTTIHDYPSYNDAYTLSRATAQAYLQQYPSIRLVLDIHRDAYEDSSGKQASSTVSFHGKELSRLMVVAGTDAYGEKHSNWAENLSLAVKLQAAMERLYPGLCRPVSLRSSAFNQDLSPGALLIEVGTAGDTRQNALNAAEALAEGIALLCHGTA